MAAGMSRARHGMRGRCLRGAGLSAAGGCCFLTKKSVDAADKVHSFHFGPGKPADKTQGKADTLLEEHIFECDHGPEDSRGGSSQNAAGVDIKRQSKKSMGLSYKVHCSRSAIHVGHAGRGWRRAAPACRRGAVACHYLCAVRHCWGVPARLTLSSVLSRRSAVRCTSASSGTCTRS